MTTTEGNLAELQNIAVKLRKQCIELAYGAGKNGSHYGSSLSAIEILVSLYCGVMNFDPKNPMATARDRLVISKGHCVLAYYNILNHVGFINDSTLKTYEVNGSELHGHATRNLNYGIEFSGGSLGMGVTYAAGMALAGKLNALPYHVYVLVGDGECNEGLVWEALMSASHYKLDNFTIIVDNNRLQYDGESSGVLNMIDLGAKFEAFGCDSIAVDGHSIAQLIGAFHAPSDGRPKAVIAKTTKGKGIQFMENKKEWHYGTINSDQYQAALNDLGR